ncbi:MAG: helix-turn-helix domain-containing protein [Actinomycetota bacterium]
MSNDVVADEATHLDDIRGRAVISVEEAAQYLEIGRSAAYRAARTGELPTLRLGRRLLVPVPRLLALIGSDDER